MAENTSSFILIQSATVDAIVTAANNEYLNIEYNQKNFTIRIKKILKELEYTEEVGASADGSKDRKRNIIKYFKTF